jgi:hypothetical protein
MSAEFASPQRSKNVEIVPRDDGAVIEFLNLLQKCLFGIRTVQHAVAKLLEQRQVKVQKALKGYLRMSPPLGQRRACGIDVKSALILEAPGAS